MPVLASLSALICSVEARLGETKEQADSRYGDPDSIWGKQSLDDAYEIMRIYHVSHNDFSEIICYFIENKCEKIIYGGRKESDLFISEVMELIKRNCGYGEEDLKSCGEHRGVAFLEDKKGEVFITWWRADSEIPYRLILETKKFKDKQEQIKTGNTKERFKGL